MLQYILLDASFVMEWHFNYNFCLSPLFCISFTEYLYFLQPLKLYLSRFLLLPLLQICASSSQQCFFVFVPNPYFLILLFQLLISGRITKHGVASPFTQPCTHPFIHSFIFSLKNWLPNSRCPPGCCRNLCALMVRLPFQNFCHL